MQPPGAALRPRRAQDHRRQLRHPHLPEAWEAHQRGGHHSPRLLAQELLVPVAPAQPCQIHLLCRRASCRAGAPPAGLVRTKPRCTSLQAHDVVMEVAQHFGKNIVKSVFGEVWFSSDSRRDIITKLPLKTVALAA